MPTYSVAQAKAQLPKLLDQAIAGDAVTITRRGKPVVTLMPTQPVAHPVDLEWLDSIFVRLEGGPVDSTAIIRAMRDEGP